MEEESLFDKLNRETAKIEWTALAPSFAQQRLICVAKGEDLVKVAVAIAEDDAATIKQLQADNKLYSPSDADAQRWYDEGAVMWAVVINPWVLAQEA